MRAEHDATCAVFGWGPVDRRFRNRLVIGHVAIALVIVLSAATAAVALGSTVERAKETSEIEQRLAGIRDVRTDARALSLAARKYLLTNKPEDRTRVFGANDRLSRSRDTLRARSAYAPGWLADLSEYSATLLTAMSRSTDDIATVAHFEDELQRVRSALDLTLDGIVRNERAQLAKHQSSVTLAHRAQWALVVASILGVTLVIVLAVSTLRLATQPRSTDGGPTELVPPVSLEPTHLR